MQALQEEGEKVKIPKFVMLIYDDRSYKGYTWNAFLKATNVAAQDYAKRARL